MRWAALWCAGMVWSCAPAGEAPADEIGVSRQAVMQLKWLGDPNSRLGASMAACRNGGFVAGAPGTGTAYNTNNTSIATAQGNSLGRAVACEGLLTSESLAGGQQGVRKDVAGLWVGYLTSSPTLSLSRAHDVSLPILVGTNGTVEFFSPLTGLSARQALNLGSGFGTNVLWFPNQPRFAVSYALGTKVELWDYPIAPVPSSAAVLAAPPTVVGFGKSLAVGNFFPPPGEEVAVGSEGAVYVFTQSGVLVSRLTATDATFGASLAVERDFGRGLDALLVGEPGLNKVHRFIGRDDGIVASLNAPGSRFGASIAIDSNNTELAVGAPDYLDAGAVFVETRAVGMLLGEAMACTAGASCLTSECELGNCIGDVYCSLANGSLACGVDQTCNGAGQCLLADAGVIRDGGTPTRDGGGTIDLDAGTSIDDAGINDGGIGDGDAGIEDAGTSIGDAGIDDAGIDDAGIDDAGIGDAGIGDAGIGDAGIGDAGATDAGTPDAGREEKKDAGTSDAGADTGKLEPVIFTAIGCSETGALPLLLLGLALLRRRHGHFPLRGRGMA